MRTAGGEVGDGFADHAVGEAGSGDLHEGFTLFGGVVEKRVSPAYCRILVHFRWIEVLWQAKRIGFARFGVLEGGDAAVAEDDDDAVAGNE